MSLIRPPTALDPLTVSVVRREWCWHCCRVSAKQRWQGIRALSGRSIAVANARRRLPDGAVRPAHDGDVPISETTTPDRGAKLQLHGSTARVRRAVSARRTETDCRRERTASTTDRGPFSLASDGT